MIHLYINIPKFENDIRALLMAFFPGQKITVSREKTDIYMDICFKEQTPKNIYGRSVVCELGQDGSVSRAGKQRLCPGR